jgi:hypothetical protein
MDCGFEQATWPVRSVKLFAFFGEVGPRGGGTMLLPGTHRLVDCYREGLPALAGAGKQNWRPFMRHHPWLARLLDGADLPDHGRPLVGTAGEIDGVPVQVGADGADADVQLGDDLGRLVLSDLTLFGVPAMRMASGDRCAGGRGA